METPQEETPKEELSESEVTPEDKLQDGAVDETEEESLGS